MASQESKFASQEKQPKEVAFQESSQIVLTSKYSNRVLLKTIVERSDGGLALVGKRVVIGAWVRTLTEVRKEPPPQQPQPQPQPQPQGQVVRHVAKDVKCMEIIQSKIPLFRSIMKILGGGGAAANYPIHEKLETVDPPNPPPPTVYLLVSDGSSVESLQVVVEPSVDSQASQLLAIGVSILAEGVLQEPSAKGKHKVELKVEKILDIGMVNPSKYPLSRKKLPLELLRECPHFRPRTTTVASITRIRSALTFGTHTFFQNHGFLSVEAPVITTADSAQFTEKFYVTALFNRATSIKEGRGTTKDAEGVNLEGLKLAIKEKSEKVEELKRSESNREALAAAIQDLHKTNVLVSQLESKGKRVSLKDDKVRFSDDFFSHEAHLTASGQLHLESYACALGNVYSFGPRFLANIIEPAKQVAEMWTLEAEIAFSQLEDAMNCAIEYFKFLCKWVMENCPEDMKFVLKRMDRTAVERLRSMVTCSVEKITYMEALDILRKVTDREFKVKLQWGVALTTEHLSYLADVFFKKPVIIYNHPKDLKPFHARLNLDGRTVAAFDMVVPRVGTLITGCQHEERTDVLNTRIQERGLPKEQYEWYLDLRNHGTVKHSGFSLGFDHMVLFITGLPDIRDAIPFPRIPGKAN